MVDHLIAKAQAGSGYYLYNHQELAHHLNQLKAAKKKVILIGVTYALLDFAEQFQIHFPELIVMETGGMKGRRKELTKAELHAELCKGLGVSHVQSEYGMTELLSQGYSQEDKGFQTPPWMRIVLREVDDPFAVSVNNRRGGINVVDLANYYSCPFLATDDLGERIGDGFKVLGRLSTAETRGCNLLYVP